jgi:hypothetical protein
MPISGVGPATAGISPLVSAASGLIRSSGPTSAGAAQSPLELALRKNVDEAFAQGGSPSDIAGRLEPAVSKTLQQYGVSEDQRSAVLDQLRQLFAQGGGATQLRPAVTQLLSGVAQSVANSNSGPPSLPGGDLGQEFDFSA